MPDSALQEIVCCIGQPVAGNPTQFMMQRVLAHAGLDWCYLTLEVAPKNLADAIRGIRALGFRGVNLSIPHKVAVIPLLDELSESAELMGAVSRVFCDNGRLIGDNTDGRAFVESLREICDPAAKRVLLLGAGGVARAIAAELARAQVAEILVANRTPEHGQALVDRLQERLSIAAQYVPWTGNLVIPENVDIVIQATSIGLLDLAARVPVEPSSLYSSLVVADVVFNPPQTWFLDEARRRGCATLNGLGMLVNQAAMDFAVWTGLVPDKSIMREAVEEYLEI
ncbi:MAG: shikimate dehydrogenase [Pirellulaceae bacterium]